MAGKMSGGNPMSDDRDGYQAYLLRLWRARYRGEWQWRASLESRRTGEHQAFAGLRQLFVFLSERCDSQAAGTPDTCPEGSVGNVRREKREYESNQTGR
jgi:hypothetical protein